MTKTLLVVGDSFMRSDPKYPEQHWSEMLPDYNVINLARDGNSLSLIQLSLYQGLAQHNPDVVVAGFTDPLRIEFGENDYYTSCHKNRLTPDQALTAKYFHTTCNLEFQSIKGVMQILAMLNLLKQQQVQYVYSLGLFEPFVQQIPAILQDELDRHSIHRTPMELSHYYPQKERPIFHVDNLDWQCRYAVSLHKMLSL
jgi:hypothetical protein